MVALTPHVRMCERTSEIIVTVTTTYISLVYAAQLAAVVSFSCLYYSVSLLSPHSFKRFNATLSNHLSLFLLLILSLSVNL